MKLYLTFCIISFISILKGVTGTSTIATSTATNTTAAGATNAVPVATTSMKKGTISANTSVSGPAIIASGATAATSASNMTATINPSGKNDAISVDTGTGHLIMFLIVPLAIIMMK